MPRLTALLLLVALAGCDNVTGDGPRDLPAVDAEAASEVETPADLEAARARWDALGLDDYELRYRVYCFCAREEIQVRVEDGAVAAVWVDGEFTPEARDVLTVDRLFEIAAEGFAEADRASARVAAEAPYLVGVSVDWSFGIADEEEGYAVTGFEAR